MQTKVKSRTTLVIVSTLQVRSQTLFHSHKYTDNMDFSNLTAEQIAQLRAALDAAPPPPPPLAPREGDQNAHVSVLKGRGDNAEDHR